MKNITITLLIILTAFTINGQNSFNDLWEKVEKFEIQNLPKSALKVVDEIYTKAEKTENTPQIIKTLFYKSKFSLTLEEDAQLKVIENFKKHINKSTYPTKNILENILANLYWQYFNQNRYKFYGRTKTEAKVDTIDFRTWDLNTLFKEIHILFDTSLQDEEILQGINITQFSDILQLQKTSTTYTPSLFDFLANNALTFYKSSETSITRPAYKFTINNNSYLNDAKTFIKLNITSKDSLSLQLNALKTYQKLIDLHIATGNKSALANIDIERLNFVSRHATFGEKTKLLLNTLQASKENLKTHKASGLYAFEIAKIYKNQSKNQKALDLCNTTISNYKESLGARKCIILKKQIHQKTLSIQAEKHIPVAKNSRLLVRYKNLKKLHFSAYKISQKQKEKFHKTYAFKDRKAFINSLEKVNNWQHQLRNIGDYLQHTTEVIVPKFDNGMYLIIASEKEKISENTIYGTTTIQATNLVLVENIYKGKYTYQVVDRNNGNPISNVQIHLKNNASHEDFYINKKLTTDSKGFASFKSRNYYSDVNITLKTKNDTAVFGKHYFHNYSRNVDTDDSDNEINIKPFIFTDRSIYRPGQTVFFKAIVIKKQSSKSEVLKNKYISVYLENVNGDDIKQLELKTNEFGSVSGEFELPDTGLTGEFSIYVDESEENDTKFYDGDNVYFEDSYTSFSVEEYKRPKFKTKFKPITKSYKINDSVTINGFAKAFSGANITDAKVVYRVHRKVQYPSWYYWRRPIASNSSQEITDGETITNDKGEFEIIFKAIPDESVSKESLPIFTYEITADVTDINGETRSATSSIKVGYHSLIASINMDNKIDKSKKETTLKIDTKNLNDEFVPAKGNIKIYKLQAPKNPLRKRPWNSPDFQDISENTFRTLFPNDPYTNNENDSKNWDKEYEVFSTNFDTKISKEIKIKKIKKWDSGKYLVILESEDKFNQKVKDEKRFTLFSSKEKDLADSKLFTINTNKPFYKVDDDVEITIGSASKNMTVVLQIEKDFKIVDTQLIKLNNCIKTIKIPVTKDDIGGFAIKYHYVNFNYFDSGNIIINIPKKQERIAIETNIFRDKLQPGHDETWSFTIKNDKNNAVAAEVLASMYDASLDEFKSHSWNFNPISAKRNYYSYHKSTAHKSFGNSNFYIKNQQRGYYRFPEISNIQYNWFGFSFNNYRWKNKQYLSKVTLKFRKKRENLKSSYNQSGKFNGIINGVITDIDKMPLVGANITVKGSSKGEITDFDGNYSIKAKKGDILVFTYLGYQNIEIKVTTFSNLNIQLAEDFNKLDEVVVVGYGTSKKKELTGAVSQISAQELTISGFNDALEGKVAGVSVNSSSGNIMIRGVSSLNQNNLPLYVIDGVPVDKADLDPNEILQINVLKDASATAIYGSRAANGVIIITTKTGQEKIDEELSKVQARKNFKETAFFFPQLKTDKNGKVSFNFTMPEALTKWKLQLLAHTADLKSATKTLQTITQKELMVIPNAPRFLREKDTITLSAKITNLTNNPLSGSAKLVLTDAISGKEIDQELRNIKTTQSFTINKDGNTDVSWNLVIPESVQAVQYKIVAKAGDFSDGEQNVLPVLTNRMLVTETMPLWVRSNQIKTFTLDKLKNQNSSTLKHHKLTLEMTSNPVWYAIQALPYLMEYPHDCAEQTFSKYYANTLASFVANSNPKIQEVFNAWKNSDALFSNLEKNQELKSLLIQETPWLRDAQSESEQKKRIGLLFDLNKMKNQQEKAINKLKNIQLSSGGFPWFKGGRYPSIFITQHIATGFGHLQKLGVSKFDKSTQNIVKDAIQFLDKKFIEQYEELLKQAEGVKKEAKTKQKGEKAYKEYLVKNNLSYSTIQYLYMRSFYKDIDKNDKLRTAIAYYQNQTKQFWNDYNLYAKGQIALILFRNDETSTATKILKSLEENSITSDELGMYWKENTTGYYYYQAPVETHALLIEVFEELLDDKTHPNKTETIDNLKIWLLKNKQTNSWKTTKATTDAVYALLLNGTDWISSDELVEIKVGNQKIIPAEMSKNKVEAGTGYFKTSWNPKEIKSKMANITINKKDNGIAWGGLHWQYFEDLDKITFAETPLKLNKKLFLKVNSDTGKELKEINRNTKIKVGDLITVRIELRSDRAMEFIHLKDMRASGVEPINVISKYKWQDNLGYYESTKDASTNFFFDKLPKGVYVFEYDVRVNNAGNFSNGITTIQSMYAPEFNSHSEGVRIKVE